MLDRNKVLKYFSPRQTNGRGNKTLIIAFPNLRTTVSHPERFCHACLCKPFHFLALLTWFILYLSGTRLMNTALSNLHFHRSNSHCKPKGVTYT